MRRLMNVHRTRYCTLWLLVLLTTLSCAGGGDQWVSGPSPPPSSTMLLAAGDVGVCGSTPAIETGLMLDSLDGTSSPLAISRIATGRQKSLRPAMTRCGAGTSRGPARAQATMSTSRQALSPITTISEDKLDHRGRATTVSEPATGWSFH